MDAPAPTAAHGPDARWAPFAIFVGACVLQWPFVAADAGWFDEIFSASAILQPVSDLWQVAQTERNLPGYYLLLKLWAVLGNHGLLWLRLLSALSVAGAGAFTYAAARRLGTGAIGAWLAAGVLVTAPLLWQMGAEARTYALVALTAAIGLWLVAKDGERGSLRILLALGILGAVQVALHLLAVCVVVGQAVAVMATTREPTSGPTPGPTRVRTALTRGLIVGGPAAVLALAWWGQLGPMTDAAFWILPVTTAERAWGVSWALMGDFGHRAAATGVLLLIAASVVRVAVVAAQHGDATNADSAAATRTAGARASLALALVPVATLAVLELVFRRDLWLTRYLTGVLPGLALLIGVAADRLPTRPRPLAAGAITAWCLLAGLYSRVDRRPKPDWPTLVATLGVRPGTQLCATERFVELPLRYYVLDSRRTDVIVQPPQRCAPGAGLTWLMVRANGPVPVPLGGRLGTRVVLARGWQDLDGYVVRWGPLNSDGKE